MGGLRLSDLSDPETGVADVAGDVLEKFNSDADDLGSDGEDNLGKEEFGRGAFGALSLAMEAETLEHLREEGEETIKFSTVADETSITVPSELETSVLFQTPLSARIAIVNSNTSSPSTDLDSPLPIARAGPVIIPQLESHHLPCRTIRTDASSFFQPLPLSSSTIQQVDVETLEPADATVRLAHIDDSKSPSMSMDQTPVVVRMLSHFNPLPISSTPSATRQAISAPGLGGGARNKTLKPSLPFTVPGSLDRSQTDVSESKVTARSLVIRGQLDAAFQSRLGAMGPPQRAVSSSSISSTSSTSSQGPASQLALAGPSKASRLHGKGPDGPVNSKNISPNSWRTDARACASHAQQDTGGLGRSLASDKGVPRPSTSAAVDRPKTTFAQPAVNAVSRPALAPRSLPQPMRRSVGAFISSNKLMEPPPLHAKPAVFAVGSSRPVQVMSPKSQVNLLKRPFSNAQPAFIRPLAPVRTGPAIRPTLGLPSRPARQTPSKHIMPVLSLAIRGGEERSSPGPLLLSRSGLKSPVRLLRPIIDGTRDTPSGLRIKKVIVPRVPRIIA